MRLSRPPSSECRLTETLKTFKMLELDTELEIFIAPGRAKRVTKLNSTTFADFPYFLAQSLTWFEDEEDLSCPVRKPTDNVDCDHRHDQPGDLPLEGGLAP